jgi:hypothetical protein
LQVLIITSWVVGWRWECLPGFPLHPHTVHEAYILINNRAMPPQGCDYLLI